MDFLKIRNGILSLMRGSSIEENSFGVSIQRQTSFKESVKVEFFIDPNGNLNEDRITIKVWGASEKSKNFPNPTIENTFSITESNLSEDMIIGKVALTINSSINQWIKDSMWSWIDGNYS